VEITFVQILNTRQLAGVLVIFPTTKSA